MEHPKEHCTACLIEDTEARDSEVMMMVPVVITLVITRVVCVENWLKRRQAGLEE